MGEEERTVKRWANRSVWEKTGWLTAGVVATGLLWFFGALWAWRQSWDIAGKSPNFVFREVFYQPAPTAISRLKYAGNTNPGEIYMRFQATSPAAFIARLKSTKRMVIALDNHPLYPGAADRYARSIHWQDALAVKHPVMYSFSSAIEYKWDGNILVDETTRTIYVYGVRMD